MATRMLAVAARIGAVGFRLQSPVIKFSGLDGMSGHG